jgi:hypothetical protein
MGTEGLGTAARDFFMRLFFRERDRRQGKNRTRQSWAARSFLFEAAVFQRRAAGGMENILNCMDFSPKETVPT